MVLDAEEAGLKPVALAGLNVVLAALKAVLAGLKAVLAGLKAVLAGLKAAAAGLKAAPAGLKAEPAVLKPELWLAVPAASADALQPAGVFPVPRSEIGAVPAGVGGVVLTVRPVSRR